MSIYAKLTVPEVWRLSNRGLAFHFLRAGKYQTQPASSSFPKLTSADLVPFLSLMGESDDTTIVRKFRDWVRQELLRRD